MGRAAAGAAPRPTRRALARTDATDTIPLPTGHTLILRAELTGVEYEEFEAPRPDETLRDFERRVTELLVVGWDLQDDQVEVEEGQQVATLPVGGDMTMPALDAVDPVVRFAVLQAVGAQHKAIYARYLEAAKELGLVRPPEEGAAPAASGRAASSSSRGRGGSGRRPSPTSGG